MVRCQATFAFDSKTFEYSLERVSDGREVIDQKEPTTVSSLHWEGNALVFMDRTKGPDSELTMSWRYELLEGRRLLRAVEHLRRDGRDQDNVWVFERRQAAGLNASFVDGSRIAHEKSRFAATLDKQSSFEGRRRR